MSTTPLDGRPPLSVRDLVADFLHDLVNSERGMGGTLVQLTLHPGVVVNSYLSGDRDRFVKPTRYLVFVMGAAALFYFAIQAWYGTSLAEMYSDAAVADIAAQFDREIAASEQATGPLSKEAMSRVETVRAETLSRTTTLFQSMFTYASISILLSLAISTVSLRAVLVLNRFSLAEALVACLYIGVHATLLYFLTLPLFFFGSTPEDFMFWTSVALLLNGIYSAYAVYQVFVTKWWEIPIAIGLTGIFTMLLLLNARFAGVLGGGVYLLSTTPDLSWTFYRDVLLAATGILASAYFLFGFHRLRFKGKGSTPRYVLVAFTLLLAIVCRSVL